LRRKEITPSRQDAKQRPSFGAKRHHKQANGAYGAEQIPSWRLGGLA
jgi:hypothetical protein